MNTNETRTPPELSLQPAQPGDETVLLALIRELAAYERAPDAVAADANMLAEALFGPTPAAHAVLARLDRETVGFALYFFNFSTWTGRPGLYLEDLFVREAARGRGIGRALLLELARIAHSRGCGRMEWAVLNWNQPAIQFYRKLGAVPLEDWTVWRLDRNALARLAGS